MSSPRPAQRGWLALLAFSTVAVSTGAGFLPAQHVVNNLADSGAGTLRSAIEAINAQRPATATIDLHVPGTTVLNRGLPALGASTAVTIRAVGFGPGQRFTIDARPASGGGGTGLELAGNNSSVLAPLTVLLDRGFGVRVSAHSVHLEDVLVQLNGGDGIFADGVNDLGAIQLETRGGSYGVRLVRCQRSVLGLAAAGGRVTTSDAIGAGILLEDCGSQRIETFTSVRCETGIHVLRGSGHVLGTLGAARSQANAQRSIGVDMHNTRNVLLANADLDDNVYQGLRLIGCEQVVVAGCAAQRNGATGMLAIGNSRRLEFVGVVVAHTNGGRGTGIRITDATDILVRDSVLGPENDHGLYATNEYRQPRVNALRVVASTAFGNQISGIRCIDVEDSRIEDVDAIDNIAKGIELIDSRRVEVHRSRLLRNPEYGFWTLTSEDCALVGSHVTGAVHGINADVSRRLRIEGCRIEQCRSAGIQMTVTKQSWIMRNLLRDNYGIGINLMHGANENVIGPGNELRTMTGTAIKLETCDNNVVTGNAIYGRNAQGLAVTNIGIATLVSDGGMVGNWIQSCLVSGTRDIGVLNRGSPPMRLENCTIVDSFRGVHANSGSPSNRTWVLMSSCIVRDCQREDFANVDANNVITATHCFLQNPAHGGNNWVADPAFLDSWNGDYRLHPASAARNLGDPTLGWPAGSVDAWGNPRVGGGRADVGAHECENDGQPLQFEPRSAPLQAARTTFRIQWPAQFAGAGSLVMLNVLGPGTPWNLMNQPFPLIPDPFMVLANWVPAPMHVNTFTVIPPNGVVNGVLDYRGALYGVPGGFSVHAAAIAFDAAFNGLMVTNVARWDIN